MENKENEFDVVNDNTTEEIKPEVVEVLKEEIIEEVKPEIPEVVAEEITATIPVEPKLENEELVEEIKPTIPPVPIIEKEEYIEEMELENPKQKKEKPVILYAIIGVLIVACILLGLYRYIWNSPKNVFLKAMNDGYKSMENSFEDLMNVNLDENRSTAMYTYDYDFDIKTKDEYATTEIKEMLDEINKLNMKMQAGVDFNKKEMSFLFQTNYDKSSMLEFSLFGTNSQLYLELKDLFDKYIKIPVEDYDELFEQNSDNMLEESKYFASALKDAFLDNLSKDDFVSTKEKLTIDDKNINTTKISYVLTEKKMLEIEKLIIEDLLEDTKFIKVTSTLTSAEEADVKTSLEDMLEEIEESIEYIVETDEKIELNVYTTGISNTVLRYEIVIDSPDSKSGLSYTDYKGVKSIALSSEEEEVLTINISKLENDIKKIEVIMDTFNLKIEGKTIDGEAMYSYSLTEELSDLEFTGAITSKETEVTKDKEYKEVISITGILNVGTEKDIITMSATSNVVTKFVDKLEMPDVSNSIDYTELTEEDMNSILSKLMENETLNLFVENIISISYMSTDDYDYDYSY